ncbi:MAG: hypothetical protein AAGL66_04570 [Pseudomonadota bacterium]
MGHVEQITDDAVHCAISATVLVQLFRAGALHVENLHCLDEVSRQMLRQIVVRSCQRSSS